MTLCSIYYRSNDTCFAVACVLGLPGGTFLPAHVGYSALYSVIGHRWGDTAFPRSPPAEYLTSLIMRV